MKIMKNTLEPSWLDTQQYPFTNRYIQLDAGKMHYVDEGEGETLVFVHGTPTWSFLYRKYIQELSKNYRCIAIDHIGFGLSEKPVDFDGTPQSHSQNLSAFIEELDLTDITLVVHDFGGPIGLSSAIQNHHRIKQIVMFNTWLWETKNNPQAQKVDKVINSAIGKFMYLWLNVSPKLLIKQGISDKKNLTKAIHAQYIKPFPNRASRLSLWNIGKALVGSSDWYQEQWQNLDVLTDKPWLVLWGKKDAFITTEYLQKWKQRLPKAVVKEYESGHFLQEENPTETIEEIRRFITLPSESR